VEKNKVPLKYEYDKHTRYLIKIILAFIIIALQFFLKLEIF